MKGIDARNSLNPDLEQKTWYCGPQRPTSDKKSIGPCVRRYVCIPCISHPLSLRELQNLKLKLDTGLQEYSKILVEIETPKVAIYKGHFSFFEIFSKSAETIFLKIGVLIRCHKLLVSYKF